MKLCRRRNAQMSRCAASELIRAAMCRLVVLSLVYITKGLGGATTEICWRPAAGSREEKTERLKPWAAWREQTYMMIDPARGGDYGHLFDPSQIARSSCVTCSSPPPRPLASSGR
jgi:hypothetical protein